MVAANAWAELNSLKLTPVYPGGAEVFLAKWEDAMDTLRDVGKAPTKFLERTLLKNAIEDQDYSPVLTGFDLMDVPPSVERCKVEIRKKGAKLESKQMTAAYRKAKMAQQERPSWTYSDCPQDDSFEEEGLKFISEAMTTKKAQKKSDPWNLPLPVWQILTRTQQRL